MATEHISPEMWQKVRSNPFADTTTPDDWPADVKPISGEGLLLLGIGRDNKLYWDGKEIEVRRVLKLGRGQAFFGILAALGAFASGVTDVWQLVARCF